MILGNNKKFKGVGYVCFIDVLGFSNDILKNWENAESNPLEKILSIKKDMPGFSDVGDDDDDRETFRTYVCRVNKISEELSISVIFTGTKTN